MERQLSDETINPSGPWDQGRDAFILDGEISGRENLGGWRGAIDTQHQRLSLMTHVTGYKLRSDAKEHDFYSLFGHVAHGVEHNGDVYHPKDNWVSVGYYANHMKLLLELTDPDGLVWDAGPTSTVGASSTSFSIGGNLSGGSFGGEMIVQGGASASFGASFSSPNVRFGQSMFQHHVQWDVSLPGVGFLQPAVPANPEEPSFKGYKWYFGAIMVMPKEKSFSVNVTSSVAWDFDYTRGITNDTKPLTRTGTYVYRGGERT